MHVHPGPGDRTANLRLLIANGVTGIRIMDGAPEHRRWRKEIEAGRMLGKPRMMQRAGLGILAGTDDGNPYTFIGLGLHDELGELVAAGLTPMQALQAATRNPARFLGRLAVQGSIRKARLLI